MDTGLKDKTVLITAASKGIGKATADAFASEGCRRAFGTVGLDHDPLPPAGEGDSIPRWESG